MRTPLVSICIPTYNGEEFITEAIESAIKQTYSNLEIIVSDDGSTDNTLEIIESYKNKTAIPIHIYKHKPNGIGANWNFTVKKAKGEFIKFLFQDDLISFDCVEKMVNLAKTNSEIGMVYCTRNILYDKNDNYSNIWVQQRGTLHKSWKNQKLLKSVVKGTDFLKDENFLTAPKNKFGEPTATLIRKDILKKIGFFDETLKQMLDLEYWYRILKHYYIGFIDESLVTFRLHKNQASQINQKNQINEMEILSEFYYNKLFWNLHTKVQWYLYKKYSKLFKTYCFIKKTIIKTSKN